MQKFDEAEKVRSLASKMIFTALLGQEGNENAIAKLLPFHPFQKSKCNICIHLSIMGITGHSISYMPK